MVWLLTCRWAISRWVKNACRTGASAVTGHSLGIKPRNMLTQLAEWARLGMLTETGPGRYALPSPADAPGP